MCRNVGAGIRFGRPSEDAGENSSRAGVVRSCTALAFEKQQVERAKRASGRAIGLRICWAKAFCADDDRGLRNKMMEDLLFERAHDRFVRSLDVIES